ncbi:hypothetical protein PybrP1_012271 [[Pythium] brassicae (nom. inval.)]|nr:hypothetical protein PybrP1_012271 [[Pythium] brassicae (nom. inval.)]
MAVAFALTTLLLAPRTADAFLECRQPNFVAKNGKILAVDPQNPSVETEIRIKGVAWSGMEKENMIPDGLWGTATPNSQGIQATTVKNILAFLSNNTFNSVRLALNAEYVWRDAQPQLAYIHAYENREFASFDDPNSVRYLDLLGRVIQTLQDARVSVLLDLHLLDKYPKDAFWYTAPFVNITESGAYKAASVLARTLCNAGHWNVLGVDLKDEMADAQWSADAADASERSDWRRAAEVLGNRVLELCPQWLVFVGGASSPTSAQRFRVSPDYAAASSDHWDGGNLKNATRNPIVLSAPNKIVYAPHAHAHGVFPRNYLFSPASNCSTALEFADAKTECVAFADSGAKVPTKLKCSKSQFGCVAYAHLPPAQLVAQYKTVMAEAAGELVAARASPVVLGSFSGVYGPGQPQQTAVLDYLIEYAAGVQGGYFWALNPTSEFYLEDALDKTQGIFGRTHYGIMKATSWQQPHADLLAALARMPSTDIPCYGGAPKSVAGSAAPAAAAAARRALAATLVLAVVAFIIV